MTSSARESRLSAAVSSSSSRWAAGSCSSGVRSALIAADAEVSGRRRSWPTAASSAERTRSVSASAPAADAAVASAPCSIAASSWAAMHLQQATLGCREVLPVQLEHAARADRHRS